MISKNQFKVIFILIISLTNYTFGQKDFTPKNRKQAFGPPSDYRDLRNWGPQFSFGPTYTLTKKGNETVKMTYNHNLPSDYIIDPKGSWGGYMDIGTAHYPIKPPKLLLFGSRLLSYYDWGIGFKFIGGKETTTLNYYNEDGSIFTSTTGTGKYYNGYVTGRFTVHKNIHFNKTHYIDNGLGINFDYRVLTGNQAYIPVSGAETKFHKPFVMQLHYELGFGFIIKRGHYFIPSIQIPIVGFVGGGALKWYSSTYRPILFKVKFIKILEKKKKGCSNEGTEEDKKRNKEYMQGQ